MRYLVLLAGLLFLGCGDKAPTAPDPKAAVKVEDEAVVADKAIAAAEAEINKDNAAEEAARLEAEILADKD